MAYGIVTLALLLHKAQELLTRHPTHGRTDFQEIDSQSRAELAEEVNTHAGIHESLPVASEKQSQFGLRQVVATVIRFGISPARIPIGGLSQTIQEPTDFIDTHASPPNLLGA